MLRAVIILCVALLLTGCVWTRLLDWKAQLKEFDRYTTAVDDGPGLILQFKEPCFRPADIGYLFGGERPSQISPRAGGGIWVSWLLRRDRPDSIGLDIALGAPDAGEDTLADAMRVPSQVLQFIPKDRFVATARAFGAAQVDRDKKEATGLAGDVNKPLTPGRRVVVAALGEPDLTETTDGIDRLTYHFHLVLPDGSLGKVNDLILELKGLQLVGARLKAANFNAWMDFTGK